MRTYILLLALILCASLLAASWTTPETSGPFEVGIASWYGEWHHGKTTASGEPFNMYELTAAHPELPFGVCVRVTRLSNGRSVVVRINDRGPYIEPRILDLSYAAASQLDMITDGCADVRVDVVVDQLLEHGTSGPWPGDEPADSFEIRQAD